MGSSYIKSTLSVFALSVLTYFLIMPFRLFPVFNALYLSAPLGLCLYFVLTYYCIKRASPTLSPATTAIIITVAFLIFQVPVRVFDFRGTLFTLPEAFIHLMGIVLGILCYARKISFKAAVVIAIIPCCVLWFGGLKAFNNKLLFGTFSGTVSQQSIPDFKMLNSAGDTLSLYSFKDKYLILDCWSKSCGVCFKEFPELQTFYENIEGNPEVRLYALYNSFDSSKTTNPFDLIKNRGYTFPVLSLVDRSVNKVLGVNCYPTVLIFDKESKLIFRGDLEGAKQTLSKIKTVS